MAWIATQPTDFKNDFNVIANPFLQETGLPFASVLDAESIRQVFREEDAFFGQEDSFSTEIVLWAFLAQTLRDGKDAAFVPAVADIATHLCKAHAINYERNSIKRKSIAQGRAYRRQCHSPK